MVLAAKMDFGRSWSFVLLSVFLILMEIAMFDSDYRITSLKRYLSHIESDFEGLHHANRVVLGKETTSKGYSTCHLP